MEDLEKISYQEARQFGKRLCGKDSFGEGTNFLLREVIQSACLESIKLNIPRLLELYDLCQKNNFKGDKHFDFNDLDNKTWIIDEFGPTKIAIALSDQNNRFLTVLEKNDPEHYDFGISEVEVYRFYEPSSNWLKDYMKYYKSIDLLTAAEGFDKEFWSDDHQKDFLIQRPSLPTLINEIKKNPRKYKSYKILECRFFINLENITRRKAGLLPIENNDNLDRCEVTDFRPLFSYFLDIECALLALKEDGLGGGVA